MYLYNGILNINKNRTIVDLSVEGKTKKNTSGRLPLQKQQNQCLVVGKKQDSSYKPGRLVTIQSEGCFFFSRF